MQLPSYLSLSRHNVYYFRFPLPKEIHPNHKSSHIRLSLSTSNEREALYTSNRGYIIPVKQNGKALLANGGLVGQGLIDRIIFDLQRPKQVVKMFHEMLSSK